MKTVSFFYSLFSFLKDTLPNRVPAVYTTLHLRRSNAMAFIRGVIRKYMEKCSYFFISRQISIDFYKNKDPEYIDSSRNL